MLSLSDSDECFVAFGVGDTDCRHPLSLSWIRDCKTTTRHIRTMYEKTNLSVHRQVYPSPRWEESCTSTYTGIRIETYVGPHQTSQAFPLPLPYRQGG